MRSIAPVFPRLWPAPTDARHPNQAVQDNCLSKAVSRPNPILPNANATNRCASACSIQGGLGLRLRLLHRAGGFHPTVPAPTHVAFVRPRLQKFDFSRP